MRIDRINKVHTILQKMELDACVLKGMENIFYLTGFRGSEGTLLITKTDVFLLTDFRYITYAKEVTEGIQIVEVRQRDGGLADICSKYGIRRMGFDSFNVTYNVYDAWAAILTDAVDLIPMEHSIEEIRTIKEPEEISAITYAIQIATDAFTEMLNIIKPGITEKDIANHLEFCMRKKGADGPSFQTIVASGPRAALPHAEPSQRKISAGETIIIDFGAQVDGYCSDETCTILIDEPAGRIKEIYTIVNEARKLALEKLETGMKIRTLDAMVRGYIEEKGYAEYFKHGLGHGVGIAVHESPSVNSVSDGVFQENMILTIEPGIYLPGIGGVRLEDMVLVEHGKAHVLTQLSKDMTLM